ncbi:MAG: EndoU domain-containing protein [Prolixibacteraceae bacterium]|nr:EndoU domain-containing protein [Prolixibacteraceae bacterium]
MTIEYYYYIRKQPYNNGTQKKSNIPVVSKIRKDTLPVGFELTNNNEGEGPFDSIFDLKKRSIIFTTVSLQKHRDRILKNKNISEIFDLIVTESGTTCEKTFIDSLHHTMVGKISKQKVTGLHFFDPAKVQIIERININYDTGVYSARVKKLDENTGLWIEKDGITTFFPDNWSVNRLFHECLFAYNNRKHTSGKIYKSKTKSGVTVKFAINEQGKILTVYPILDEE